MRKSNKSFQFAGVAAGVVLSMGLAQQATAADSTRVGSSFTSSVDNVKFVAAGIGGGNVTVASTIGGVTDGSVGGKFEAKVSNVDVVNAGIGGGDITVRTVIAGVQNGTVTGDFKSTVSNVKAVNAAIGGGKVNSSLNIGGVMGKAN